MTTHRDSPAPARMEMLEPRLLLSVVVLSEGFEGTFPGSWTITSTGMDTSRRWGRNNVKAAEGTYSAFCGESGNMTRNAYVNYETTTLERSGISLAAYSTYGLKFQYWLNTEDVNDYFTVSLKDKNNVWREEFRDSGDKSADGWQSKLIDLSAYAGQTGVTLQFYFKSDSTYVPTAPSGVWLDEVSLLGNTLPDLTAADMSVSSSGFWGQTISLQGQVKNIGEAAAGAFTQKFYLSADTTWGNVDDWLLGTYSYPAGLAAGATGPSFSLSVTLPGVPPSGYQPSGTYYIGMKTDYPSAVVESDETNNGPGGPANKWIDWDEISVGYNTHIDMTLYKVTDTSGTANSSSPGQAKSTFDPGEAVRITFKVSNAGITRSVQAGLVLYAPDNATVVYDSHDPAKTPSGQVEDNVPPAPLAEASTAYYSFDWVMPAGAAPGAYDVVAAVRDIGNWNFVLDNTAAGQGTVGFGPEARVRDQLWRTQAAPANRTSDDTSEYLMGRIWVNVVLPASTGAASTEAWTLQEIADIKREMAEGAAWWTTTLPDAHLSFTFDWSFADNPVATTLEPISQTPGNDYLWMNDMLAVLAPGTTGTTDERLRAYADLTRRATNSDWAYTVFVADDTNDADHMFAGSSGLFAYAMLGGPMVVMTYHNDGWGIDDMAMVFAHETAHMFYTLDEYAGSGAVYGDFSGYLNVQNLNAVDGNPSPATIVPSLMGETDKQRIAYDGHTSSPTSLQMLGYRDTDADGILDILDTLPTVATTVQSSDAATGAIQILATAGIVPRANNNPNGEGHAISLNTVSAIQYKVDEGVWLDLPAQNGAYDGPQETAVLQLAGLAGGSHHIYLRSRSSAGSWSAAGNYSNVADVPFTSAFDPPPVVTGVRLNNRDGRGPGAVDPSGQGVRTITVTFSEAVAFLPGDVTVETVAFPAGSGPVTRTLTTAVVAGTDTAAMTITLPLGEAVDTWVRVRLSGTGIKDLTDHRLDGNAKGGHLYIVDAADLPTGDGAEGGDAVFYVGSLRGDFSGDRAVTAADKAGFLAAWNAKSLDADFRGAGFGVRPPDGKVTLGDMDGFTSVYLAGVAAARHLDALPAPTGEMPAGEALPAPAAASAGSVDILRAAAGWMQAAETADRSPSAIPLSVAEPGLLADDLLHALCLIDSSPPAAVMRL